TDLRDRAGARWCDLDLVFPNKSGSYLDSRQVNRELKAILVEVGIDPRVFHDLRHSFATMLFASGVNPKGASEALGHSKISTTLDLYGDVTPDMQDGVGDVMNRLFGVELDCCCQ
ncbi:MAG TPA: tyrosine-type recombinase/integrase, partial [Ktedonobacteraceae bacterium]